MSLLSLPPELREQILQHICVFPGGIDVGCLQDDIPHHHHYHHRHYQQQQRHPRYHDLNRPAADEEEKSVEGDQDSETNNPSTPCLAPFAPPLPLFLTCTQLYAEASSLFYTQNVFHLSCSGGRPSSLAPDVLRLLVGDGDGPGAPYPGHYGGGGGPG